MNAKKIKLFIETPFGERCEIEVFGNTLISQLVTDFMNSQNYLAQADQISNMRFRVDWVNLEYPHNTERLDNELSISELGIKNGDLLTINAEIMAGCFPSGTKVSLATGEKIPIEHLEIGDTVLSYSLEYNLPKEAEIVGIYRGVSYNWLLINGFLAITPTHLVYLNGSWQCASNIKIGDHLQHEDGKLIQVETIEIKKDKTNVFNLDLSEKNLYIEGVLVSAVDKVFLPEKTNFYANDLLVGDYFAKTVATEPFPKLIRGGPNAPFGDDRNSLRGWWHKILCSHGRYSCYAMFLLLPSDKGAIKYVSEYGDELDLITSADCLVIALSKKEFHIPSTSMDNNIWSSVINSQVKEGHSILIANHFGIDYENIPCMILFKDIRSSKYIIVSMKNLSADEIASNMRETFSLVHKAAKKSLDPLTLIQQERNKKVFLHKGESIVSTLRTLIGKTFETGVEAWLKTVVK